MLVSVCVHDFQCLFTEDTGLFMTEFLWLTVRIVHCKKFVSKYVMKYVASTQMLLNIISCMFRYWPFFFVCSELCVIYWWNFNPSVLLIRSDGGLMGTFYSPPPPHPNLVIYILCIKANGNMLYGSEYETSQLHVLVCVDKGTWSLETPWFGSSFAAWQWALAFFNVQNIKCWHCFVYL